MNEKLLASLNQSRRDALVPYYIKHVIPTRNLGTLAAGVVTPEDLYEYLLMDPLVSGQMKTSRIAEAVASTQLYLHRCREQLEPGTDLSKMALASRPNGYFSRWSAYNKRYATWSGLQRLLCYPASFIDPELRYSKTQLFQELESAINQGRITEERVEQAFNQYVSGLRTVLDIRYDSGYQVEPASAQGEAYFCGSIPGTTGEYYWRKVDKTDLGDNAKVRNPGAWSEWLKIDAPLQPIADSVPSIVYFANRLHVLCVHEYAKDATTHESGGVFDTQVQMVRELQIATLRPSGQWGLRSWPLSSNPDGVFAAELRSTVANSEPMLGVFLKTPKGVSLYRFSKLLQMAESPGTGFTSNFVYENKLFSYCVDVPVRQPLIWTSSAPATQFTVVTDFSYQTLGEPVDFSVENIRFMNSGGSLKFAFDTVSRIGWDYTVIIGLFKSASLWGRYTFNVSAAGKVTHEAVTPCVFSAFAEDATHRLVLLSVVRGYSEYPQRLDKEIPLQRSNNGVAPRITNFDATKHLWIPTAFDSAGRTQMLYTKPNNSNEYVLTTLAGPILERKMLEGVEELLSWGVQTLLVDPNDFAGNNISRTLTFNGGVGLYTWELFFHAPLLIANRLLAEQRFDEAEFWFKRIFDPAGYRNANGDLQMVGSQPRYWNVWPLQQDTSWNSSSPADTDDPDVIAAADPMHYKLAVYLRSLELLGARGDQQYRQQTRDSLGEARMWYMQALQMLGQRPTLPLALAWDSPKLEAASTATNLQLRELEQLIEQEPVLLAPASLQQIAVLNGPFLPPVDAAVLAYWDRFEGRLYNLRNNLSIDGQPLALALFEAPADPAALQQARLAGDGAGGMNAGITPPLWPQRFLLLLDRARNAVQQVIQFGASLQGVLERRDADALNVLQQTQQGGLLAMMGEVHVANLASLEHTLTGLQGSQAATLLRQQHYDALSAENISTSEQLAMDLRSDAVFLESTAGVLRVVAGGLNLLPNVAGMAVGWGEVGGLVDAFSDVLRVSANVKHGGAVKLDTSEQYRRRRQDWDLQREQARLEGEQIGTQIAALNEQITMAKKQQQQTELEQAYSEAVLEMLSTRFTGQALFNWQAARLATLYYQLYDTVSAQCAQAQISLRWETRDNRNYLRPGNWNDLYQGLLAGESLLLSLQQMEAAYLRWDQRTLEVRKTNSLLALEPSMLLNIKQALTPDTAALEGAGINAEKVQVELGSDNSLTLTFKLDDMKIQSDYPATLNLGTIRLIKTLSVSLPVLLGPYQNVQALLRYDNNVQLAAGCKAVALSHGLDDSGQFQLDFNDGKYLPFEGLPIETGTFSLVFPNATSSQHEMLLSMSDVIVHVSYTIR